MESADVPRPSPGPGQVLVRVFFTSVNPVDWKRASGKYRLLMPVKFPAIPGFDISGEVAEVGPGVTEFAVGDRVHARIAHAPSGGGAAEFAVAGVDVTAKVPAGMDMAEAAGLPLAGMTALQGLRDRCGLAMSGSRARVLVVGASGGVGHLAVQIAAASGATVVGVSSGRNTALVKSLGAHDTIDYTKPGALDGLAPFDIVLDCVGGDTGKWLPLLAPGGHYGSCMPGPGVLLRSALNAVTSRKVHAVMLKARAEDLRALDDLATRGKLRVVVDSHFPLSDLKGAWEKSMGGRSVGKIVVDVAPG